MCCSVLQCVIVCCGVLQCVAVWCSVVQYGAVWCSVLRVYCGYVAVPDEEGEGEQLYISVVYIDIGAVPSESPPIE